MEIVSPKAEAPDATSKKLIIYKPFAFLKSGISAKTSPCFNCLEKEKASC
jgi:hypothetical protein